MAKSETVSFQAVFDGQNTKKNGITTFKFKVSMSDLANVIKMLKFIDKNIKTFISIEGAKDEDDDNVSLGETMFGGMAIDWQGETTLKLETDLSNVELSNMFIEDIVNKTVIVSVKRNER